MDRYVFYEARDRESYLLNAELVDFLERELEAIWCMYLREMPFAKSVSKPYAFISNQIKKLSYGKYNTACVSDLLEKIVDDTGVDNISHRALDKIQVIFAKLDDVILDENAKLDSTSDRVVAMNELYDLERLISEESMPEEEAFVEKVKELFSNWKISGDLLLGEYVPERHQVILYAEAIDRVACNSGIDFKAELSMTLAHELFHAFHYEQDPKNVVWKSGNIGGISADEKRVIKESLADYMSAFWICNRSNQVEEVVVKRIKLWAARYYCSWPYARALNFLKDSRNVNWAMPLNVDMHDIHRGFRIATDVMESSFVDAKSAYAMI